jgi:uncharacterized protein YbcI
MRTIGETEEEITKIVGKFLVQFMGRGASKIKARVIDDMVVIRTTGMLTETEQHLAATTEGRDLLKDVRRCLITTSGNTFICSELEKLLKTTVLSTFYDCNVVADEEIFVATLLDTPAFRIKAGIYKKAL